MPTTVSARVLLRLAFVLLLVAAGCAVWAVLARQAPGSPIFLGVLAAPIEAVRDSATVIGLVFLAVAQLLPSLVVGRVAALLVTIAGVGAALDVGVGLYAASHGLHAIQFKDPRPDVAPLVLLRSLGDALLALCLLEVTRRVCTRR